jgi:hypothetical protein
MPVSSPGRAAVPAATVCHVESFFSTVKSELGDRFDGCGEAEMELFDYIEVLHDQQRRHSTSGQAGPAAFEKAQATQTAQPNHLRDPGKPTSVPGK